MSSDDNFTVGTAFLLWLGCVFGLAGIHRFYLGKPGTGILYLLTWGLFGIGSVVDLVRMHSLVENANVRQEVLESRAERRRLKHRRKQKLLVESKASSTPAGSSKKPAIETKDEMRLALTQAAAKNNGMISVTQGVLATSKSFAEVEEALDAMAKSGYVGVDNHPDSGVVIYTFRELV